MLQRVAAARELDPLRPVRSQRLTRAQMLSAVKEELAEDLPEYVARGTQQLLFALGIVGADFDYRGSVERLLGRELAGYYDPDDETMYLAEDLSPGELEATLAHELVHALQDQHFDVGRHLKYREGASDELSALHALAEGDATSAMLEQMLAPRGMRSTDLADEEVNRSIAESIPDADAGGAGVRLLYRAVLASYVDGFGLVQWTRRRWGWARVNEFWRVLPQSTEQILHPEKLLAREAPEEVPVPSAPAGGPRELVYHDVLGEQSVRVVLEEWVEGAMAREAAGDWGGDRVAVYCGGGRCAVAWHLRYDFVGAAVRGWAAFAAGIAGEQGPGAGGPGGEGGTTMCRNRSLGGPIALVHRGRSLVVVVGPYASEAGQSVAAADCTKAVRWGETVAAQR